MVMLTKPFRPLTFKRRVSAEASCDDQDRYVTKKKARISPSSAGNIYRQPILSPGALVADIGDSNSLTSHSGNTPLSDVGNVSLPKAPGTCATARYTVLWRNFTNKKHKTWEGDGILSIANGQAHLKDLNGRHLGKSTCDNLPSTDSLLSVGGKEVMIESVILKNIDVTYASPPDSTSPPTTIIETASPRSSSGDSTAENREIQNAYEGNTTGQPTRLARRHEGSSFQNPMKYSIPPQDSKTDTPLPRHDPSAPDALIMRRPSDKPPGKRIVDVVVDPLLSKNLREHQRTGVQFLYECVMGMRPFTGEGAILADEMGLGKTLQVITLLWTLLKQNPIHGDRPVVKKALIVCPVTLIKNWKKEFRKWLGLERVGVFVLDEKRSKLTDFTQGKTYNIMIIGYEKLRTIHSDLQKGAGIDILIADEGHRLKSAQNKCGQAIKSFATGRKVILSGTPLQNDLSEFYFTVDFVNPGILGTASKFKKEFEAPILSSRRPDANEEDVERGQERSEELAKLTSLFILRRTADILAKYLPEKTEYVLFCRPTSVQATIYRGLIESPEFPKALATQEASLQLIGMLKKICNCPSLLFPRDESGKSCHNSLFSSFLSSISHRQLRSPGASGKLQVLDSLLFHLHKTTDEKVVIVSHYTATLDIIENLLSSLGYAFLRLDGTTSQAKRQDIVDMFNRTGRTYFAFLLSAKSGGMGLNLSGASRIVLFDNDWNPSTDLQAMARIYRDGQKRPCKIYRLLTKGALDEKIYQRQLTKISLADSVVDNKLSASSFTEDELKDLFRLDEREECQTHTLLGCQCAGVGNPQCRSEDEISAAPGTHLKDKMQLAVTRFQHFSTARLIESLKMHESIQAPGYNNMSDVSKPGALQNGNAADQDFDKVLMNVLQDGDNRVDFIFSRRSC